jgi:hypothetical protein
LLLPLKKLSQVIRHNHSWILRTIKRTNMKREQKITLGEMRQSGPRRLLVYCGDYRCAHSVIVNADRWPDRVRLSDLEPKFTCQACGHRGADVRPLFEQARMATGS